MDIEQLAKRKVELRQFLEGMQYLNAYGVDTEEMVKREMLRIEKQKELLQVEAEIESYIKAA